MPTQQTDLSLSSVFNRKDLYKSSLKDNFPLAMKRNSPVVGIWYDSVKDKSLVTSLVEAMKSLGAATVLLTEDGEQIPIDFREKVCAISSKNKNWDKFFEACDMMIILSDKVDITYLKKLWHNGILPIAPDSTKNLQNYDPNHETGNSFTYSTKNIWEVFAATVRALETFKFPYDWKHIVRNSQ